MKENIFYWGIWSLLVALLAYSAKSTFLFGLEFGIVGFVAYMESRIARFRLVEEVTDIVNTAQEIIIDSRDRVAQLERQLAEGTPKKKPLAKV